MPDSSQAASMKDLRPLASRILAGVRSTMSTTPPTTWFGPSDPLSPVAQDEAYARAFDYPVTQNLNYEPRAMEAVSFADLKNFADAYDLLRLVIETRKDQLVKYKWNITTSDEAKRAKRKLDPKILEQLTTLFKMPDRVHTWQQWLRVALEQMLVTDAAVFVPRRNLKGDVVCVDFADGATFNRLVNGEGRTPLPPFPAYQQVLKGLPAVNYTTDDLLYAPRNVRAHKLFGYSPVEQVLMTANIGLRRELHQLAAYTDGNIPDAIATVPETWTAKQITSFQKEFDAMLAGNSTKRRRIKFIPPGNKFEMLKPTPLFDQFDEWMTRIICFAFSISPTAFVKMTNRASGEAMQEAAQDEGLIPTMLWVEDIINTLIQNYMGFKDAAFAWVNDRETDPKDQMVIDTGYVTKGVLTINEARANIGRESIGPNGDEHLVYTATGVSKLDDQLNPPEPVTSGDDPGAAKPGAAAGGEPPAAGSGGPTKPKPGEPAVKPKPGEPEPKPQTQQKIVRKKTVLRMIDRSRPNRKEASDAIHKVMAEALAKDRAEVVAKLRGLAGDVGKAKKRKPADDAAITQAVNDLDLSGIQATAGDISKTLSQVAADGGGVGLAQIGLDDEKQLTADVHDAAVTWARQRSADLVTELDATTRTAVKQAVVSALQDGASDADLAEKLEQSFAFSPARAELIARTETARADVAGNLEAYKASGVVVKKEWVMSDDHPQEDECNLNANDGAIPIDKNFSSGDAGPPAHPNCECDLLPVIEE